MRAFFRMTPMAVLFILQIALAQVSYEQYFTNATLRIDYFHHGTSSMQSYSLDQVFQEGPWPGNSNALIDTMNLGSSLFKVFDLKTNRLIYSHGFSTIFHEWQTTDEAQQQIQRTISETVRCPMPRRPVQMVIATRDRQNHFIDRFSAVIDPQSRFVNREIKKLPFETRAIMKNGDSNDKVDLAILGDGYSKNDLEKYRQDVQRYTAALFQIEPFKSHQKAFNIWSVAVISQDTGIDQPRQNSWKNTVLGTSYNSFDSQRYILSLSNQQIRDVAALVPYEAILILINSDVYGGGGIYNCYATSYTLSKGAAEDWSEYVFVHEFGHHFAGLGDEYYTSDVAYNEFYPTDVEPWEPNVSPLLDPAKPKWGRLIKPGTPLPTPWQKAEYDSLSIAFRNLKKDDPNYHKTFQEIRDRMDSILHTPDLMNVVGFYQGSGYASTGLYRPALDCIMFSRTTAGFCPVCRDAIERMIKFLTQ